MSTQRCAMGPLCVVVIALFLCFMFPQKVLAAGGVYDRIEASFELPQVSGNPFDFTQNDVKVTIAGPEGKEVVLPAFFDGGKTWRIRHSPTASGKYTIRAVALNGQDAKPEALKSAQFDVSGTPKPGFVRISAADKMRFVHEDGSPYYPLGYNLAWRHMGTPPMPVLTESLNRMGKAGVNWSRIWMNHWDDKNLDWNQDKTKQVELGQLDLSVAKNWDDIVQAAEANGVYFQMALQHHGQYSTGADANWQINPWNKANGGWLENAVQFFSDAKAMALTKAKYRYIIARWGCSPSIMAWELFNEVENTDAFRRDAIPAVAAWHAEMAKFVREQDPYHHLVTTSSRISEPSLFAAMDYYQPHVYPPDLLAAIATLEAQKLDRPYFYGEIGGSAFGTQNNPGDAVHRLIWGSLMSQSSGAAQYWFWYVVEPENLLFHYTAAHEFIEQSGFAQHPGMLPIEVGAQTESRGSLRFGPGMGWEASKGTEFAIKSNGIVEGIGGMSAYLQGNGNNKQMFPFAVMHVDYPAAGTFAVRIDETTPDGGKLNVTVDGQPVASLDIGATPQFGPGGGGAQPPAAVAGAPQAANTPAGQARPAQAVGGVAAPAPAAPVRPRRNVRINAALEVPVSAGVHTIRLENTGADWLHIRDFVLAPYAPAIAVQGKGDKDLTVLWLYHRDGAGKEAIAGAINIPRLSDGNYRASWWDTYQGKIIREETRAAVGGTGLTLSTPPIDRDVAVWIRRLP